MPDSKKSETKIKSDMDEKIKIAHQILLPICACLIFIAVGSYFKEAKKAPPVQYIPPPIEKAVQGHENYPKLANMYLSNDIRDQDVNVLSNWDFLTMAKEVDSNHSRNNVEEIRNINMNLINIARMSSMQSRCEGGNAFDDLVYENNWWLYDYEGNRISGWPENCTINQTYLLAGCDPYNHDSNYEDEDCGFEALANYIVNEHIEENPTDWDGVLYDVVTDNQRSYAQCRKDADLNGKPTWYYTGQIEHLTTDQVPNNDCTF